MKKIIIYRLFAFLLTGTIFLSFLPKETRIQAAWGDPVRAKHAIVASQHELASKIGVGRDETRRQRD